MPPLECLLFLEAAARNGSFKSTARIDTKNATGQEARDVRAVATAYGKVCDGGGYERSRRLRRYAAMLATFFVLTATGVPGQTSAQTDTRPNILVFLSDDMGWGQPGFNGGTEVATPNMDRLANEGVKLTQFYVQPVCSPTRASLMTGRYAWKNGMEFRTEITASNGMLLDERTIAEALHDAGYATWMVGKWHLGQWRQEHLPLQRGFDHHYGFYSARVDSFTLRRGVILDWHRNGRPVVESGYSTFLLADEAVQLIERHDGNRPFFLYMAFGAVHVPHDAPDEYILEYLHLSHPKQRAMLAAMDVAMGQVMDALDRKGVLDNTLIVFLNDNGALVEAGGNEPYRGLKGSYLEGGIRVPAALRWPGHIPSGSESDALLHVVDLFPTFARLAGAASVAGLPLDGLDAWETIAEGAESPREEVVHSLDVIRVGDWKLIEQDAQYSNWNPEALRLYNIDKDPYEETNLAASEAEKIAELRDRLAYHRPFARDGEAFQEIPDFPPGVYGAEENAVFGDEVQTALEQLDAGNPGPALLRIEVSETSVKLVYDEALDAASEPPADAFTVVVNPGYRSAEVTNVGVSGREVVLTLAMAVAGDNTVGLTYEVPDTGAIQDTDSLEAVGVTWVTGPSDAPPVITTAAAALIFVEENETAVATLAATDADHLAEELTWRITGGADRNRFKLTADGVLTFGVAQDYEAPGDSDRDNFYEVTVEVSDGANPVEAVFRVRVTDQREPPGIPEMPSFSGKTAESLTVHWSEPENTGPPITDYDVRYREQGAESFIDGQHEGPGLSLALDALKPGTIYEVQVRATNDEGTSDWSEPGEGMTVTPLTVGMTTGIEPPVEGPFTVRFIFSEPVTGFSLNDIETDQDPACMDDQNTPVFCDPVIGPLETIDDRIFTASVTPGTGRVAHNYTLTITVPANTVISVADGKPNEAATLQVRIAPPGVTVPISSLRPAGNSGNGRVTLRWNTPTNTGGAPIVRYEYRWMESGGEFSDWMRVDPGSRVATVSNLTNGREYVLEVRAVNALGYGGVETVEATPSPSTGGGGFGGGGGGSPGGGGPRHTVPDAPGNLLADGGDEQVTLSWEAPEDDGGLAITDYEVRIDGRNPWISIGSTDTTHTVTGLVNGATYVFQVRAVNAAGSSPYSNRAEATPGVGALDFAHFANGAGIISDLVFVNVATHPIRPALYFYDKEGQPIDPESVVDLTGDLEVTEDGALSIQTAMEPLGELTISTHGQGEVVSGSVKVVSNGPIGGVLRFDLPGIGVAGVAASPPVRDALFPARRQGGLSTAAAIHNPGEEAMGVRCRLMKAGVVLEEMQISLAANGQEAQFIEEMFTTTDTSNFVGLVRCTGPGRFTGVAVELDAASLIFTTLPVVPVNLRGRGREAVLDFAHFANGEGITSDLVFVNVETQPSGPAPTPYHVAIPPIRPVLYFYDKEGNPIAAESVVEITGDLEVRADGGLSVRTEMEPLGELTISTHGQGELVSGSVRVVSDGPIGGVLRFDLPGIGVAGVGASQPVRDALFPARREGDLSAAAAIRNLGEEAMEVSCRLMKAGIVLEEAEIPLEANGQEARYIEELFPRTDTSDFVGSVRCTAPGEGAFTGVAVELNASNQIFTTLPVVPIPERMSQE